MHDTLQRNFDVQARWVDDQAYDTFQNAQNTARLLKESGAHRILLVTRGTHMGRSVQEFVAVGFDVIPAPTGMLATREFGVFTLLPDAEPLLRSNMAIYELLGEPVRAFLTATHLRRH